MVYTPRTLQLWLLLEKAATRRGGRGPHSPGHLPGWWVEAGNALLSPDQAVCVLAAGCQCGAGGEMLDLVMEGVADSELGGGQGSGVRHRA